MVVASDKKKKTKKKKTKKKKKKKTKNSFQNTATVSRNNKSNIHNFQIISLSFKTRTKIGVCTVAKPHAIFQSFLLEMLGLIHSFMTGNFNPKLWRGFEAIAIQTVPMRFYMYFH